MTTLFAAALVALAAATGIAWRAADRKSLTGWMFAASAGLPVTLAGLASLFVWVKSGLQWGWSACRLAPAIGILKGFPLYSAPDHGPINGWLYGPIPALCWLPAGLFGTPYAAIVAAETINTVLLVAPIFAVCLLSAGKGPGRRLVAAWCAVAATASFICFYPTWYMTAVLTSDATAVGFGTMGCILLARAREGRGSLALAAAFTAAAVWCKQIEAPLAAVQVLWLLLCGGRPLILRYSLWFLGFLCGMGAVFAAAFGAGSMYFNMWVVPTSQFLTGGWGPGLSRTADAALVLSPLFAVGLLAWKRTRAQSDAQPFPILLMASALLLPVGIATSLKVGADLNSVHSFYFAIAGAAASLASLCASRPERFAPTAVVLAAACFAMAVFEAPRRPATAPTPHWDVNESAYDFTRAHPGFAYFPWDPLAALMAENRYYHFEYGVQDRILAGRTPGRAQIAEGIPEHLRLVVYPVVNMKGAMIDLMPPYSKVGVSGPWTNFYYDGPEPAAKPGRPTSRP